MPRPRLVGAALFYRRHRRGVRLPPRLLSPLHDIGKVGIPDSILQKPGKFTADERKVMETHTVIAATYCRKWRTGTACAIGFLHMAIDVARHHHERYDGAGLPGSPRGGITSLWRPASSPSPTCTTPCAALRLTRRGSPATAAAVQIMADEHGHFDPALFEVFRTHCAAEFERLSTRNSPIGWICVAATRVFERRRAPLEDSRRGYKTHFNRFRLPHRLPFSIST